MEEEGHHHPESHQDERPPHLQGGEHPHQETTTMIEPQQELHMMTMPEAMIMTGQHQEDMTAMIEHLLHPVEL